MLKRVTITGADDTTDAKELLALSQEFPFVEWGILVSKKQEGNYRFPSRDWIDNLIDTSIGSNMHFSTHVCGSWVRQLLIGELNWDELPDIVKLSDRIQINTHGEQHTSTAKMMDNLLDSPTVNKKPEFIFQWDNVNQHLAFAAQAYMIRVSTLFDTSGGAGIVPTSWPSPLDEFWCGYAGGLGPDNVLEQLNKIWGVVDNDFDDYWIDMERRVRTPDDSKLDMVAVRKVLELTAPFVEQ